MNDTLEVFLGKIARELELPDPSVVKPDTEFRQLPKWDSMSALIVLSFLNIEYGKIYTAQQLSGCKTFRDVYNTISKD